MRFWKSWKTLLIRMKHTDTPRVVGLTGAFGSGKSTAAAFFQRHGYLLITLSSFLEEEAHKRKLAPITRKILQDIGNEWRESFGKEILVKKALEKAREARATKVVIDGIRNTGEIAYLQEHSQCTLIAILSDRKIRFKRLQTRKRREELDWELFEKLDTRDRENHTETGLQVDSCIKKADIVIENNGNQDEFLVRLETLV